MAKGPGICFVCLLSLTTLISSPVLQAQTNDNPAVLPLMPQLQQLIEQQRYQQALQLAQQHLDQAEGDPDFDFYYGLSAAQSGLFHEALFVFERLSNHYPEVVRYRLELARCYYFLSQLDNAEREFRLVLSSQPPASVRTTIDAFLDRIAEQRLTYRSHWNTSLSYGAGYDSNINSSTDLNEIDILLAGAERKVRLNKDQTASGSGFYKLNASTLYRRPISKRSGFDLRLSGQRKANARNDDYDLNAIYADGGMQLIRGRHQWRLGAAYQHYWLDDKTLQLTPALNLSWKYLTRADLQFSSKLEIREQDNKLNDDLDATQAEINSGFEYASAVFAGQAGIMLASDSAPNSPLAKNSLGINLSGQYLLSQHASAYALGQWRQMMFQHSDHDNVLVNGKKRRETLLQAVLGASRQLTNELSLYGQLTYMTNQSNIDIYQYDRNLIECGLTLVF